MTFSAFFSALRHIFPLMAIIAQRIQSIIYFKYNIAAFATVSAIGTPEFQIFFVPKRTCAISAIARF